MKVVEDFEEAVREHAFRGAAHPEDRAAIEHDYLVAKQKLVDVVKRVYKKGPGRSRPGKI